MELLRNKRSIIGAPNIIHSDVKAMGRVQCYVRRADCPDVNTLMFEDENAINILFLAAMRDTMNSNVDFALDNLLAVSKVNEPNSGDDGISILNVDAITGAAADYIAAMGTAVHPTAPSGSYWRQWQGIWQEVAATETVKSAEIGNSYNVGTFIYTTIYATENITPDIVLVLNDILTINWKITLVGA